ncbi:hypothetical protein AB6A40_008637 [Gnathostoma spinigerum]|uniref:Uncharacterized protein n=1 Tax=Gnathostoma spinigerum TaxID=75299 RepID=A0ABD6EXX4_9BILA
MLFDHRPRYFLFQRWIVRASSIRGLLNLGWLLLLSWSFSSVVSYCVRRTVLCKNKLYLMIEMLFLGGIFLFIVFSYSDVGHISTSTRRILYGVFSSSCFVGNIILLLVPVKDLSALDEPQHESLSNWKMLSSAFWLACTPRMLLLSVVFAYSGLELSFWSGIFTTCISFTSFTYDSHRLVALNAICQGLGQVVGPVMCHETKIDHDSL